MTDMFDLCGIYAFVCRENERKYVGGTTTTFQKRMKLHLSNLKCGKHHSPAFQADYNLYGPDAFEFRILEVVEDVTTIQERELFWMNELQPEYNGKYVAIGYGGAPVERKGGKSVSYRMTVSDDMAAAIERARGLLTVQEYTLFALAQQLQPTQQPTPAPVTPSAPQPQPDGDMLGFD